jgi:hypothetical protein
MARISFRAGSVLALVACGLLTVTMTGCQTTIAGQTLPSANYLHDDVQYFTKGPEFKLSRQVEALEQYKLQRQKLAPEGEAQP